MTKDCEFDLRLLPFDLKYDNKVYFTVTTFTRR